MLPDRFPFTRWAEHGKSGAKNKKTANMNITRATIEPQRYALLTGKNGIWRLVVVSFAQTNSLYCMR